LATLSPDDILSNVRKLKPKVLACADEAARLRKLPADIVETLRDAGVFRISVPKGWGGPEMPLPQQVELMELLATADASVSWCVKIGSDTGVFAAFLPELGARALFPRPDMIMAGQATPNGRAVKVDGGYRVSGRWGFASGCTHADVIVSGCVVVDKDGKPTPIQDTALTRVPPGVIIPTWVLAPVSAFNIEDTWYSHGLAGSGSHHYSVADLFVPDDCVVSAASRAVWAEGPLYATTISATLLPPMAGTPLGLMRHAIDTAIGIAMERKAPMRANTLLNDLPRVRLAFAHAETAYGAARAFVYDSVRRAWDDLDAGRIPSEKNARDMELARIHAFRTARDVTRLLYDIIGAAAVYQAQLLERLMRDAATMNQHALFSDNIVEDHGASLLGGPARRL